jgi:ABC-type transport system substrate-binding protein
MNKKMLYFSVSIIAVFLLSAAIAGNNLGVSAKSDKKSNVNSTRTDAWIEDLQANFDNPQWFYDHLNTTDRLNIRLALDYAIPRTDIINSILNTFGVPLATTDVPQTGAYFNPTPQAREYNLTIAASLLTKVFGYEYGSDDSATPYDESLPYFFMGLVVPSTNPLRSQWAERIQFNYKQIGVDVSTILLTFDQITSRLFANIAGIGYDYDHGGSDGLFVGWAGSPLPDDGFFFYSSQSMPYGNYQFVNSTTLDNYINIEDTNKDEATRIQAYHDVQTFLHEQVVKNVLFQNLNTYVMNKDLHNFNPFYAGQGALPYQNLSFTGASAGKTDFVVAIPGELSDMNPLISNAVYDNYFIGQLWQGGLLTLADQPNDPTFSNYSIYTNMADWYNVSTDQLTYFFT